MTATIDRPCRYCGGEVTSTKSEVDYCAACFYTGTSHGERFAALLADLGHEADVWHTGGGNFAVAVVIGDRSNADTTRYVLVTEDWSGTLPDADAPDVRWMAGYYDWDAHDGEWWPIIDGAARAEVVAAVRTFVDGPLPALHAEGWQG